MSQRGSLYRRSGWWVLRYRATVIENGQEVRKHLAHQLIEISDRYRTPGSVRHLAAEFLLQFNTGKYRPQSTVSIRDFIEKEYLPYVAANKKPSTLKGYKDLFEDHVRNRLGSLTLREFRPADGTRILAEISKSGLGRRSMYHVKSFLSGAFAHAISQGWLDTTNPMRDSRLPGNLPAPQETHAYTLEEIDQILNLPGLSDAARLAINLAAWTGLRKSELMGLRWEDYDGTSIHVRRAIVNGQESTTKNDASRSSVPVLPRLKKMLDAVRLPSGWILRGNNGRPLNLNNLAAWHLTSLLKAQGRQWHGWHSFRRGLATNLARLDVDLKTIQSILRHSNAKTTLQIYVKHVQTDAVAAMQKLENAIEKTGWVQ